MSQLRVRIQKNGEILSAKCVEANTYMTRLVGLLSKASLPADESLLFPKCKQVHTFFMRFAIDVVFLDQSNKVVDVRSLKPWRVSPLVFKADKILELAEGRARDLKPGDSLEFLPC